MIITVLCPSCETSFPVDTDKVPEGGVDARCSVCPTVFRVDRPDDAPAVASDESEAATAGGGTTVAGEAAAPAPGAEWPGTEARPHEGDSPPEAGPALEDESTVAGEATLEAGPPLEGEPTLEAGPDAPTPHAPGAGWEMREGTELEATWEDEERPPASETETETAAAGWDVGTPTGGNEVGEAPPTDTDRETEEEAGVEATWEIEDETRPEEPREPEGETPAVEPEQPTPEDSVTGGWEMPGMEAGAVEAEPLDTDVPGPGTVEAEVDEAAPPFESRAPGEETPPTEPIRLEEEFPGPPVEARPPDADAGTRGVGASAHDTETPPGDTGVPPSPAPGVGGDPEVEVVEPELDVGEVDPGAGAVPDTVPAPTEPPTGFQFGKRDPHEKAQRLARVLVSDMIMYNPERHGRALDGGTLREDFEDEIRKSWDEYVEQVGEEIATDTTYFSDALNEILARGERVFEGNPPQ